MAKELGVKAQSSDIEPELYAEVEEKIDFDEFAIKISDLKEGMTNIVLLGRIGRIFDAKAFVRKDGSTGNIGSLILYDDSGSVKVSLWDAQAQVLKSELIHSNELVRIVGGYAKKGLQGNIELNIGKKGKMMIAQKDITPSRLPKNINLGCTSNAFNTNISPQKAFHNIKINSEQFSLENNGFEESEKLSGLVYIDQFKEIDMKNGEKTFLLKMVLKNEGAPKKIVSWGFSAVDCLKQITDGDLIEFSNLQSKKNPYTSEKELHFTKYSRLFKL